MFGVEHSENIRAQKEENANHLERKPMQTSLSIESNVTLCVCHRKFIFFVIWSPTHVFKDARASSEVGVGVARCQLHP